MSVTSVIRRERSQRSVGIVPDLWAWTCLLLYQVSQRIVPSIRSHTKVKSPWVWPPVLLTHTYRPSPRALRITRRPQRMFVQGVVQRLELLFCVQTSIPLKVVPWPSNTTTPLSSVSFPSTYTLLFDFFSWRLPADETHFSLHSIHCPTLPFTPQRHRIYI